MFSVQKRIKLKLFLVKFFALLYIFLQQGFADFTNPLESVFHVSTVEHPYQWTV